MPVLARFYGLVIKMYFQQSEHNPPHIHVIYGEYVGVLELSTARMIEGDLPQKALALAQEWTREHSKELLEIWNTQEFRAIEPLK
jgi:hypothetical protein